MPIIHFDSETTGLFLRGQPSTDPGQPHIVSLSAILDDDDGITRHVLSAIIKPQGWKIDERMTGDDGKPTAFSINGISNATAERYGLPMETVMDRLHAMAYPNAIMCAFNFHFDWKMLKIAAARYPRDGRLGDGGGRAYFETLTSVCTMEAAAKHITGKRFIKLSEAHQTLFGEGFDGAHNSLADAQASRRIYYKMKELGALPEPKPMTAPEYATPAT